MCILYNTMYTGVVSCAISQYLPQESVNESVARTHNGSHGDNITDREMEPLVQRTTDTLNTYYRRYVYIVM